MSNAEGLVNISRKDAVWGLGGLVAISVLSFIAATYPGFIFLVEGVAFVAIVVLFFIAAGITIVQAFNKHRYIFSVETVALVLIIAGYFIALAIIDLLRFLKGFIIPQKGR